MSSKKSTFTLLGAAFLIQALASLIGGLFLFQPLIVPGDIAQSMAQIANSALQMRASILVEMITAMGIVMLGSMLYLTLKKQDNRIALIGLGLYVMEATLLGASKIAASALLLVSQASVAAGHPEHLRMLGSLLYEAQDSGYALHMLPFALGATLFYSLLHRSGLLPRALSVAGIIAAALALVGMLVSLMGYRVPLVVFLPNLPFELTMGIWFLVKGLKEGKGTA